MSIEAQVSRERADHILGARKKTATANKVVRERIEDLVKEAIVLTEDHIAELEVCETLNTQDYVVFLVQDISGQTPVGLCWAYAEKLKDNSGFLFSAGKGDALTGMTISACAQLDFEASAKRAGYTYGGSLEDDGAEIAFKSALKSQEFASFINDIVRTDGGGQKRLVIAATEDDLYSLVDNGNPAETPGEANQEPSGDEDPFADNGDPFSNEDEDGAASS